MDEQQTCGKGLAENSALPAKLAELMASLAEILAVHIKALDVSDPNSKKERDVYARLVDDYRDIAARLEATAQDMASHRDLPMGRHDTSAMASAEVAAAFEKFVWLKQELLTLLQKTATTDRQLLDQIRTVMRS